MAQVFYDRQEYKQSNSLVQELIKQGKDSDDKRLLVEAFLLESKIIFESKNVGKARAALTVCRANANQIQVPSSLSAELESTAAMLHLEERDFPVAYSYFYEAFELY
jgi:26S proteasome regulatory subunit N6